MTIHIGNPQKAISMGETAAAALKAAGLLGSAYGSMCMIGLVSETTSYNDIAQMIYQAAAPVVSMGAALYKGLATMAGAAPISGDLLPGAPEGVKVGASAMVVSGLGTGLAVAGVKLSEMMERAKEYVGESKAHLQEHQQRRITRQGSSFDSFEM